MEIIIIITDDNTTPIGAANTIEKARAFALNWLTCQYDEGEWEAILQEDGYESREDLFHDMMLGMDEEWERFDISFAEVLFVD